MYALRARYHKSYGGRRRHRDDTHVRVLSVSGAILQSEPTVCNSAKPDSGPGSDRYANSMGVHILKLHTSPRDERRKDAGSHQQPATGNGSLVRVFV